MSDHNSGRLIKLLTSWRIFILLVLVFSFVVISIGRFQLIRWNSFVPEKTTVLIEPHLMIHTLCRTGDNRDIVNLPMTQDKGPAIASILAGGSRRAFLNDTILHEIDFLVMFEINGIAMASVQYFTHCFLNWRLNISVTCEVIGFGVVQGTLTLSYRYSMDKEGRLVCPISNLSVPTNKDLSVRIVDKAHKLDGLVRLCRLDPYRKVHYLVGCSQPLFNIDKLEAKWPGLIRTWVLFYVDYLGFGSVSIYDNDGTAEPYIGGLVKRGILKYYKSWAPTVSMLNLSLTGSPFCSETMMENQCVWQHRGLSEWVMLIHAPDNFLNDVAESKTLRTYLETKKQAVPLILLTTLAFGHPNRTIPKQHSSQLFHSMIIRECQPITIQRHLPLVNPRKVMMLFVHVALEPFHNVPTILNECPVQVNHYITMFHLRSIHATAPPDNMFCLDSSLDNKTASYISLFQQQKRLIGK